MQSLNKELLMVVIPALGWFLFALGGTEISPKVGGIKAFRREGMSLLVFGACFFQLSLLQSSLSLISTWVLLSLSGYGSSHGWWRRALTSVAFGLIGATFGLSVWNLVTVLSFVLLFILSNTPITSRVFIWKICEGLAGCLIGIQVAYSLLGYGLTWRF